MPNWCSNRVTVTGRKEEVQRFKNAVESEDSLFDFNRIVPMPRDFDGIISGSILIDGTVYRQWRVDEDGNRVPLTDEERKTLKRRYGATNWYDWCVENWGTKWGASDVEVVEHMDECVEYLFLTAWAPPEPIIWRLREMFPNLSFSAFYDEPGCELAGYI